MVQKYKEVRSLNADALRALCKKMHWYTKGDIDHEYAKCLKQCFHPAH